MADDKMTDLIEANRRGLLPPDMKRDFDEAVKRGLMPSSASAGERFLMGATDPARGVMEIAQQIMGTPATKPPETTGEGEKRKDVPVPGQRTEMVSATDPMRIAGNIANPANLIPPLTMSRIPRMASEAKTVLSATIPALMQPVGETNNFFGEKAQQGLTGAGLGFGFMVAGKGVSKGVDALGRWLVSRYPDNIMSHAVSLVLKRIDQDRAAGGLTAKNMIDMIRAASAEGRPLTLADVGGKNVARLAGNVYRKGGEGGAIADRLFETRDQAAANRLRQEIAQYIHGGMTVFEATEALLTARSAAARPLYEHTDSLQGIWSPRLGEFMKDPVIKEGMKRGYEMERLVSLAENRPFNPTAMGVDVSDPNNIVFLRTPNMRVLDMAKQGLDALISDERNEITGRLSARGVALDKLRRGYLSELDALDTTGVYRKARAEWGGYSASLDALKAGRAVFAASPEENAAFVAKFKQGSGDIEFYRMGVADMLNERIAKTGFSADEANALIKNDWMRRQLKPAFLSEGDFNGFVESVAQESQMFARRRSITGGSQTAERLAEDQSPLLAQAEGGARAAGNLARGHYVKAVADFYRMYRDVGVLPDPKLNEATAKILFSPLLPHSRTETSNAIRMLAPATPGQRPPPRNHLNYLAGPARSVQDLIAPALASETGELSGGRPLPLPRFQQGGVSSGGLAVVGEEGPEVVDLPPGARVTPNNPEIDDILYQMGSGPVPPETDELTRALPGYEQRSPGELAMIRTQEATRPTRGRADITPEHMANMLVTGGSILAGPEALTARAIAAAPKTMTGLLAALGTVASTSAGGAEPDLSTSDGIKEFQREAKKQGMYLGNIDGVLGEQTKAAKKAFDEAKAKAIEDQRRAKELELREKELNLGTKKTELETQHAEQQAVGQEELKNIEENLPTWRRILRNYGPQVGYIAGALAGPFFKWGAVKASDKVLRRSEKLVAPRARAMQDRVANINEFWRKGGAGEKVPFLDVPGSKPGFAVNPDRVGLDKIYPPLGRAPRLGTDIGVMGAFGLESAYGHSMKPSHEEMSEAYKAVQADATKSNIERLQALKDRDAIADALINMGRVGAGAYATGTIFHQRQLRPDMAPAEAEQMRLQKYLLDKTAPKPTPSPRSPTQKNPTPQVEEKISPRAKAEAAAKARAISQSSLDELWPGMNLGVKSARDVFGGKP